jgi:hypothetical protein
VVVAAFHGHWRALARATPSIDRQVWTAHPRETVGPGDAPRPGSSSVKKRNVAALKTLLKPPALDAGEVSDQAVK